MSPIIITPEYSYDHPYTKQTLYYSLRCKSKVFIPSCCSHIQPSYTPQSPPISHFPCSPCALYLHCWNILMQGTVSYIIFSGLKFLSFLYTKAIPPPLSWTFCPELFVPFQSSCTLPVHLYTFSWCEHVTHTFGSEMIIRILKLPFIVRDLHWVDLQFLPNLYCWSLMDFHYLTGKWISLFKDRRHRPWLRGQYQNLSSGDTSGTEDHDDGEDGFPFDFFDISH